MAVGLIASLVLLVAAASASAAKEFEVFNQCPTSNAEAEFCIYSKTLGGEVAVGNTKVPIKNPITLQGGLDAETTVLIPALNGETLSKTPQTVPGGLLGIVAPEGFPKWLQEIFNNFINKGPLGVTATTELVGQGEVHLSNLLGGGTPGVVLPVQVKLNNEFLGSKCIIGSKSSPIKLQLTTGETSPPKPNKSIKGKPGAISLNAEENILFDKGFELVDNSFSAPAASGCASQLLFLGEFFVDLAVNAKLGLPSAAGHNTAILSGDQELAEAKVVKEHP
ncbi:MAG TPA: hypothetical protein VGX16_00790 [Solirubrobacteraceae bacterium]|nr:hypothetical protein [Solirubrobacteraceae bacterium]